MLNLQPGRALATFSTNKVKEALRRWSPAWRGGTEGRRGRGRGRHLWTTESINVWNHRRYTLRPKSRSSPRFVFVKICFVFFTWDKVRWSTHTHTLHAKRNNIREMVCRLKDGGQTSTRKKKKAEGRFLSALERSVKLSCSSHSHHNLRVESALTSSEIHPSTGLNLPEKLDVRGRNTLNELFIKHFSRH